MKEFMSEIRKRLLDFHCPRWEEMPDVELYADQVVNYIERHLSALDVEGEGHLLTASMINNYVKMKLIPAPVKKRYGVSFRQAVTKKRVSVAAEMLREGGLPIAEIALSVGFGSVHSFYRAFSEEYGLSPQEYRRREGRMA